MDLTSGYTRRAKVQIVHKAAASAWRQRVPWAEALAIATKAIASAKDECEMPAKGRGKGKARGRGRG